MTDTPPRLRSFAPPTRDKMIIWSAVAGYGIMALLGRQPHSIFQYRPIKECSSVERRLKEPELSRWKIPKTQR